MDKIILSQKDIEFVLKWRDEHKELVRLGVNPMRAVKIICTDSGITLTAIREAVDLRIGINQNGKSLGSLDFEFLNNGMFRKMKDSTKISDEDKQSVLTVYSSVMALIVFGRNSVEMPESKERKMVSSSKTLQKSAKMSKRNGATYILASYGNEPQTGIKRSHRSPEGIFSVRGHYRRYKSGKVIWIEQYTKGVGEIIDKSYRIGNINR